MIKQTICRRKLIIKSLLSHCLKPEQIKLAYDGLLHQPELYTGVVLDWR
ncbi:hypothetical protein [Paenibacillus plantarum]|nr:hypothetical protein [Paenibacillus plantarum]